MLAVMARRALALLLGWFACQTPAVAWGVVSVQPEVVRVLPHDSEAFTQGLLLNEGWFFESTGLRGRSSLRRVDPADGTVAQSRRLADDEFGEGLALVGQRLVQLTWQEHVAHVYDVSTFEEVRSFEYTTEGWGLCFDGERVVMSDGSDNLYFRDPDSFELLQSVAVTRDGEPVRRLNELECVSGLVYANVWTTDTIVAIDANTGQVVAEVDAAGLLTPAEALGADVLNGIAYDPASGHFFLTGKLWPKVFEVKLAMASETTAIPRVRSGAVCQIRASAPGDPVHGACFWGGWVLALLLVRGLRRRQPARWSISGGEA